MRVRVYKDGPDWMVSVVGGRAEVTCGDWQAAMSAAWGLIMYPEVCS